MRGGGLRPNRPKTFARNRTLPQEATDVSIYDKGPGLQDVSGPVAPRLFKLLHPNFREFFTGEVRRIPIPRTWVNKAKKKAGALSSLGPIHEAGKVPRPRLPRPRLSRPPTVRAPRGVRPRRLPCWGRPPGRRPRPSFR